MASPEQTSNQALRVLKPAMTATQTRPTPARRLAESPCAATRFYVVISSPKSKVLRLVMMATSLQAMAAQAPAVSSAAVTAAWIKVSSATTAIATTQTTAPTAAKRRAAVTVFYE